MNIRPLIVVSAVALAASSGFPSPKNIILFIGDGMSVPQRMTANEFSIKTGGKPLVMNAMPYSAVTRTCSADSLVTDSAAAATAIACGKKTNNCYSGVDAQGKPLESCATFAHHHGRKVGIVSTVTITHATPAGFYAHRKSRGDTVGISADLADSGFDLFAGGGLGIGDSQAAAAYGRIESAGYRIVKTRDEFMALKPGCGKVMTRFTDGPLETAIDAKPGANEPTLAEIVAKSIELLANKDGFFLMAEGGRIDWSGHGNDAATNLRDVLAMDDAVRVALDFAAKAPDETLVVVTGDHETGGMTMGFAGTGYALYMDRLANQTMSVGAFEGMVAKLFTGKEAPAFEAIQPLVTKAFGFKFEGDPKKDPMVLSKSELDQLKKAYDHDAKFYLAKIGEIKEYDGEKRYLLGNVCRIIMSNKSGIGWTSGGHTAMPVLTSAQGEGAKRFTGFIENTDIANIIKDLID